ncbi:hypothetical protein CYY_005307 [Polysphondylium violaceum]|uniref:ER membrane protein complex subunit 2 n=1 Tax=Polysphondylium violaceum TaxID=133409 RepID=A0A8J4V6Z4_9MYCE|nr:hypothetical protein CYY_005307 [Polysphondylium violaceum]
MTTELIEYQSYHDQLHKSRSFNWVLVRDLLRFLRKSKFRKSLIVSQYGYKLVDQYFSKLDPQEGWDLLEQVIVCCLDCNQIEKAQTLLNRLVAKFTTNSVRVKRLIGMLYECQGLIQEAINVYQTILQEYPSDSMSMKRQISIYKSQGIHNRAIQLLNTYLQIYMCDFEAWLELASIHINLLSYKSALFCYEEIILNAPINYLFYVKYAEISYSLGGADNFILALKYYTHSLELNSPLDYPEQDHPPTNLPSIYGIIMSIYSFCESSHGGVNKLKDSQVNLMEWAQKQLLDITNQYTPDKKDIVSAFIKLTDIPKKSTTPKDVEQQQPTIEK